MLHLAGVAGEPPIRQEAPLRIWRRIALSAEEKIGRQLRTGRRYIELTRRTAGFGGGILVRKLRIKDRWLAADLQVGGQRRIVRDVDQGIVVDVARPIRRIQIDPDLRHHCRLRR